jgi:hypothetical protein
MGGVVKNPYVSTLMETITDLQGRVQQDTSFVMAPRSSSLEIS